MVRRCSSVAVLVVLASIVAGAAGGCSSVQQYLPKGIPFFGRNTDALPVRQIAVLPFAYRGPESRSDCDICPNPLLMSKTSPGDALLVTAFFYEALQRYPRFDVLPYDTVRRFESETMDETVARITEEHRLDAVIVGALLEMRPRRGDPQKPSLTGGASIYAAALDVSTGEPVWAELFDGTKHPPNFFYRQYKRVVATVDNRRPSSEEIAEYGVTKLVKSMSKKVR